MAKSRLEIKGIKTFRGMEGTGLNATLYFDGKKVCEVIDEGCGGEIHYQWYKDSSEEAVLAYVSTLPTKFSRVGMSAKFLIGDKYGVRTDVTCPKCDGEIREVTEGNMKGYLYCEPCIELYEFTGNKLDSLINTTVDEYQATKQVRGWCRTKTVVRMAGTAEDEFSTFKAKFSPVVKAALLKRYPTQIVEFVNERFL